MSNKQRVLTNNDAEKTNSMLIAACKDFRPSFKFTDAIDRCRQRMQILRARVEQNENDIEKKQQKGQWKKPTKKKKKNKFYGW